MASIGVFGAGSWGCAMAIHLSKCGHEVTLWAHRSETIEELKRTHMVGDKLPGIALPEAIGLTDSVREAAVGKDILVLAVPSTAIRETSKIIWAYLNPKQVIVNLSKGLESKTRRPMSIVIREELPLNKIVILSGPSHAEEVAIEMPTALVAASEDEDSARYIQDVFMNEYLRVYTSRDVRGVEMGGAIKNVIALAAGMSDGLGYGDNSRAALITRGVAELTRLVVKLGGEAETVAGLTGMGDLIVTCDSRHSRNKRAGFLIGQGKSVDEAKAEVGMVVEGINTARSAFELSQATKVSMPIVEGVYNVLFEGQTPRDAVQELMMREKKPEH